MAKSKKTAAPKTTKSTKAPKAVKEKKSRKAKTTDRDPLVLDLPCALCDEDREADAMVASTLSHEIRLLKIKMVSEVRETRKKIRALTADVERLTEAASTGFETRPVQCAEEIDGEEVKLVRSDTGEEVDRRPITPEESTRDLFPGEQKERVDGFLTDEEA